MRSWLAPMLAAALASPHGLAAQEMPPAATVPSGSDRPIIVRPPPTVAERHRELRAFTREVIRPAPMHQPVPRFAFPVCVEVRGLAPDDAAVIAERLRENADALGVGADRRPGCVPTVRIAFMAPAAGPAESWLTMESPQLAHLAAFERKRVLAEAGPVRAWHKVALRDAFGQPFQLFDDRPIGLADLFPPVVEPYSASDPIVTTEITGAAVLIAKDAAHGLTLGQLADYATLRALLGAGAAQGGAPVPTILTLFDDPTPPPELTTFDRALVRELYDASRHAKPRRVYNDIARATVTAERSGAGEN